MSSSLDCQYLDLEESNYQTEEGLKKESENYLQKLVNIYFVYFFNHLIEKTHLGSIFGTRLYSNIIFFRLIAI